MVEQIFSDPRGPGLIERNGREDGAVGRQEEKAARARRRSWQLRGDNLPESLLATGPVPQSLPNYHEAVNEMKKKFILQAIEQANGNYTAAAKLLSIHSTNLHRLIRTLGLRT